MQSASLLLSEVLFIPCYRLRRYDFTSYENLAEKVLILYISFTSTSASKISSLPITLTILQQIPTQSFLITERKRKELPKYDRLSLQQLRVSTLCFWNSLHERTTPFFSPTVSNLTCVRNLFSKNIIIQIILLAIVFLVS